MSETGGKWRVLLVSKINVSVIFFSHRSEETPHHHADETPAAALHCGNSTQCGQHCTQHGQTVR